MSEFETLHFNPPTLTVKENAKELIIEMISCMCDNRYLFKLKRDAEGYFKLSTGQFAYSNFQLTCDRYEIEWAADEDNWYNVFQYLNSGTSRIKSVKSR